jgi:hypothetical protein
VIYAIAPSRTKDHDIWVGTDDGQIWRTRNEGKQWTNVTPPGLTAWSKVGIIEASHFDSETAYAAIDRHRLDDFKPYVYRTRDGGKSWQMVAAGIPDGSFVNAVREDTVRKGLLYAATEKGVYVSFDDGDHWQSLQQNLPVTSVRDIDVHGNDLVIATHGRAFWIMDDISPLRSVAAGVSAPYLFPPARAIRMRAAGFTGTPMPKDEPMAPNPPNGAFIDYVLSGAPAVTLEIYDAKDTLVRRYSSSDPVPAPNIKTLRTAPEWFTVPSTLETTAGMHRFVWPMRLAGRTGPFSDGVWAPPGQFKVVLTAGDKRMTQPLTVAADPRVTLPPNAYAEQFALAKQIDALRGRLAPLLEKATGESATALRALDQQLQRLMSAVDGADAAPTPDARAGYEKLKSEVEKVVQ